MSRPSKPDIGDLDLYAAEVSHFYHVDAGKLTIGQLKKYLNQIPRVQRALAGEHPDGPQGIGQQAAGPAGPQDFDAKLAAAKENAKALTPAQKAAITKQIAAQYSSQATQLPPAVR